MDTPWHSMELHGYSMEVPWNSMDFHPFTWNAMDFHRFPWISVDFHGGISHGMTCFVFDLTVRYLLMDSLILFFRDSRSISGD